eukprot:TRINITY_DN35483_c0_g1_i1.p1 TRINITY_DN35483_c0_g1~~TRINITY_DN35483_c0_g1_i1.p1  ORF type:complete len:194 (+),score=22.17 TRINITY_DN35483_c0_g1_i1:2-583(+)
MGNKLIYTIVLINFSPSSFFFQESMGCSQGKPHKKGLNNQKLNLKQHDKVNFTRCQINFTKKQLYDSIQQFNQSIQNLSNVYRIRQPDNSNTKVSAVQEQQTSEQGWSEKNQQQSSDEGESLSRIQIYYQILDKYGKRPEANQTQIEGQVKTFKVRKSIMNLTKSDLSRTKSLHSFQLRNFGQEKYRDEMSNK